MVGNTDISQYLNFFYMNSKVKNNFKIAVHENIISLAVQEKNISLLIMR